MATPASRMLLNNGKSFPLHLLRVTPKTAAETQLLRFAKPDSDKRPIPTQLPIKGYSISIVDIGGNNINSNAVLGWRFGGLNEMKGEVEAARGKKEESDFDDDEEEGEFDGEEMEDFDEDIVSEDDDYDDDDGKDGEFDDGARKKRM